MGWFIKVFIYYTLEQNYKTNLQLLGDTPIKNN